MVRKILFNRLREIGTKALVEAVFDALPGWKAINLLTLWLICKLEPWPKHWPATLEVILANTVSDKLSDVLLGKLVDTVDHNLEQVESKTLGNKLGNLKVYLLVVKLADTIVR